MTDGDGKPFRFEPPKPAPEVPARDFDHGHATYIAPPEDGSGIELTVDPNSERLQVMHPWPAWDGKDFLDMPVLIKTKGKTTTDHISPAGPWLRYRGHLDKFSDNMFMGAINAFTDEAGKGIDVLSGEKRPADRQDRAPLQGAGRQMGRRRRRQLRRRQQPRARGTVAAAAWGRRGHRPQLCPHPRIQPEEAGPFSADLPEPGRLRPHPRRRSLSLVGLARDGAGQAGRVPYQACRRDERDACAQPHLQHLAAGVVPQGLGAEPFSPLTDWKPFVASFARRITNMSNFCSSGSGTDRRF